MGHAAPVDLDGSHFHCAACDQDADYEHYDLQGVRGATSVPLPMWALASCTRCDAVTLLYEGQQVIPPQLFGDFDAVGLPREIAEEIRCARATLRGSPRASAAHSRAALYAMLRDVAMRSGEDASLPIADLFTRLVRREETVIHASFRDNCLRGDTLAPAGAHDTQDPPGTAFALLELLRMAKTLFYA